MVLSYLEKFEEVTSVISLPEEVEETIVDTVTPELVATELSVVLVEENVPASEAVSSDARELVTAEDNTEASTLCEEF